MSVVTDDYRTLAGNTSAVDWAKKYYGLKRNYDSMSRICKVKCSRNNELEGELNVLTKVNEKYDGMSTENRKYAVQNRDLMKENTSLHDSVTKLEKKLNLTESTLIDITQSLKNKSKIQMNLEEKIQQLSKSFSETEDKREEAHRKLKAYDILIGNVENNIQNVEKKCANLEQSVIDLESQKEALNTNIIQRDNIILNKESKIKTLNSKYIERNAEYDTVSKQHEDMKIRYKDIEAKCTNYKMDIDIYTNRLKHYEKNEKNENKSNIEDKIQSLRDIISELETQHKYNLNTINNLNKIKQEGIHLKQKYNELKQNNEIIEEHLQNIENKYNNLQQSYQGNNEKYNKLCIHLDESRAEKNNLKQTVNERENALRQLQKQYIQINNAYDDLQQQYSSYLHKNNATESDEIKILSERQEMLKNDVQSLLLENEEWIKKYNNLKATYDALNEDYVNSANQCLQIESLMAETKEFHKKNIQQNEILHKKKVNELNKEIESLNGKITTLKNDNIMLKNKPTLTMSEYTLLCDKEDQFRNIADKMYISDQSCEQSFKCGVCNDLYVDPITCQPCGHSFCRKCIKNKKEICKECNVKTKYFGNGILENLTNKFKMRFRTHIPALQQLANRKTNVVGVPIK